MTFSSSKYPFLQQPHKEVRYSSRLSKHNNKIQGFPKAGKHMWVQSLVLFFNFVLNWLHLLSNCFGNSHLHLCSSTQKTGLHQDRAVHFSISQAWNRGLSMFLTFCEWNNSVCCAEPSGHAQHSSFASTPPPPPSVPLRSGFSYGWGGPRICLEQQKTWQNNP